MKPPILILHASGVNRDAEAAWACELAGGAPEIVHINQLRCGERRLNDYPMLLLPGGFSYGDALGAGTRLALDLQRFFHDQLHEFIDCGKLVFGICNGFQVLVKAGVLPGARRDVAKSERRAMEEMVERCVTLTDNAGGRFECRWVYLAVNPQAKAPFLRNLKELIFCPVAHGEGNLQIKDPETLAEIEAEGLVAFRYVDAEGKPANGVYPINPNGSAADIAGLCNHRGNVLGLMPHPEDHVLPIQSPLNGRGQLGLALFQAMVASL